MQNKLQNIYNIIENTGGYAPYYYWKEFTKEVFDILKPFLRPTNTIVNSYHCPNPTKAGCPREVIKNGNQVIAICNNQKNIADCPTVKLSIQDIITFEIDWQKLAAKLAKIYSINYAYVKLKYFNNTHKIGDFIPIANKKFPVYFTIPSLVERIEETLFKLLYEQAQTNFIIIVPTYSMVSDSIKNKIKSMDSIIFSLEETIIISKHRELVINISTKELLANFKQTLLDKFASKNKLSFFATPIGASWKDIEIKFKDGHTVQITCQTIKKTANYTNMGMNKQNGDPTKQWLLLQQLSNNEGVIKARSSMSEKQLKKQKSILSQKLRQYFNIDDEPIPWSNLYLRYKTKFKIFPD